MNTFGNWLITASIIQGSDVDPVTYIVNDSDLRLIHQQNMIFKYADTDLVVPDIFSLTIPQELQHISDWTKHHNLKLETKSNQEPGNNY